MTLKEKLFKQLIEDEGLRLKPYRCTANKLTIGIGRNLDDCGITEDEALLLLENDTRKIINQLKGALPFFDSLSENRQLVLINMGFNLGIKGLLGFKKTLESIQRGDFELASNQMLQSKWASQVKSRAIRLANLMKDG